MSRFQLAREPMSLFASMRAAGQLARQALLPGMPLLLLGWLSLYLAGVCVMQLAGADTADWSAAVLPILGLAPAAMTPLLVQMLSRARGTPLGWRQALRAAVPRLRASVAGALVYGIAFAFGTGMLVLPGLVWALMFGLWWIALLAGDGDLFAAFRTSTELFERAWLRITLSLTGSGAVLLLLFAVAPRPVSALTLLADAALLLAAPVLHCAVLIVTWHDATLRCPQPASDRRKPGYVPYS
jgi:hypothetical protein